MFNQFEMIKVLKLTILLPFFLVFFISYLNGQTIRELNPKEHEQVEKIDEMAQLYLNQGDNKNAGLSYSKVAFIFWNAGQPRKAIEKFLISANILEQNQSYQEVKNIYSNIGLIYTDLEELEFARKYFEKSLEIRMKIGNNTEIAAGLLDVAFILQVLGFYDDAIENIKKALKLAEKEKNSQLIMNCYQQLSTNYQYIGNIKKSNEFSAKAESYLAYLEEQSLKQDFETEVIETQKKVAQTEEEKRTAQLEYELNQMKFQSAQDSLNQAIQAKQDSLFEAARIAKQRELEIKTLNQQKKIQDLAMAEQEAQQQKQRLIILSIAGGLILMVILAIVMLRANRSRKRANTKLEKQNKEINEKSEQLGQALKKIAHQNQNITQSINYAKGIQQALLPQPDLLNNYISDSFILFKPRDIVSGDFYWFRELDAKSDIFKIFGMHRMDKDKNETNGQSKKFIVSAVDCTGHGVPGAFMSMIGYNLLDEITNKGITRPDLILEELHRGVRFTLKQKETNNQDGMDMALCVIDKKEKHIEFAGAKNPLVYIQNNEIKQIKGDKNGIGGKSDDHKFTMHKVEINGPTWFYMFSDGFVDQFGGENGRKFMIKKFRQLLFEIHKLPMKEQQEILDKKLKNWMGTKYNQIDDVLVIGFKINN